MSLDEEKMIGSYWVIDGYESTTMVLWFYYDSLRLHPRAHQDVLCSHCISRYTDIVDVKL